MGKKGKHFLYFRGKKVYYNDRDHLAEKLHIEPNVAQNLIDGHTQRVVIDPRDRPLKIDLKSNFAPVLKRIFGVKKVSNKVILSRKTKLFQNKFTVSAGLPRGEIIKIIVSVRATFKWSDDEKTFTEEFPYNGIYDKQLILQQAYQKIQTMRPRNGNPILVRQEVAILDKFSGKIFKHLETEIRDESSYQLSQWSNIIYFDSTDDNCVKVYFKQKFPKISHDYIDSLGSKTGVQIQQIYDFCKKNQIKCRVYDISGKMKYYQPNTSKSHQTLSFVHYNNHIYPFKKSKLLTVPVTQIYIVNNAMKKIRKFVQKKVLPYNIQIKRAYSHETKTLSILSFCVGNKKYVENPNYLKCLNILTLFGKEDLIFDSIKLSTVPMILEKVYFEENLESFIPNSSHFIKEGFNYKSSSPINFKRKISTIDKNKCYPYCLYQLPFLIICDWRTATITPYPKTIIKHNLYIAKPEHSTILLPNTNIYSGYHLKKCKKYNIQFTLLEEITTTRIKNKYVKMIDELLEKVTDPSDFKQMMVAYIGMMECESEIKYKYTNTCIYNEDYAKRCSGYKFELDDDHFINCKMEQTMTPIYNKKPIAIQLKDMSRLIVYEKMAQLGLETDDIIQIKTDSITYYGKLPNDLDKNDFYGWKEQPFNELQSCEANPIDEENVTFFTVENLLQNHIRRLHNCYAGCGKTTYIIDTLVPFLQKNKTSFQILTPSHSSAREYRKKDIPCSVIQKYIFSNTLPDEDYIIIDELGMINKEGHDLLFKIMKTGKEYEGFGDFGQLLPVNSEGEELQFDKEHYNKYMYNQINNGTDPNLPDFTKNYRNKFTKEYYDQIKNEEIDVVKEVHKYSIPSKQAEIILCFRNAVKEKYNQKFLEYLKKEKYDVGVKYICATNKLAEHDIYNNLPVIITSSSDDNVTISDGEYEYEISKKQLDKNFELGYVLNLYQIQGHTIKSYHWISTDDYFLNGRRAYTIISRLGGQQ